MYEQFLRRIVKTSCVGAQPPWDACLQLLIQGVMSPSARLPRLPGVQSRLQRGFYPKTLLQDKESLHTSPYTADLFILLTKGEFRLCRDPVGRGQSEVACREAGGTALAAPPEQVRESPPVCVAKTS